MLGRQVEVCYGFVKGVKETHALANIEGPAKGLGGVEDDVVLVLVQHRVEGPVREVLADHHQVRRGIAATNHRQHVGMRENSEEARLK